MYGNGRQTQHKRGFDVAAAIWLIISCHLDTCSCQTGQEVTAWGVRSAY